VFGVKDSLVRRFPTVDDPARAAEAGLPNPFRTAHFDARLLRAEQVAQPETAGPRQEGR
jgi:hydroxyquinol 1,2-dioxygenase